MCTKYNPLHYSTYLTFCVIYASSVDCITFSIVCCTSCKRFIDKLSLDKKLWIFKVQKVVKFYAHINPIILRQLTFYEKMNMFIASTSDSNHFSFIILIL